MTLKCVPYVLWYSIMYIYIVYYLVPGSPTNLMISPPSGSCDQLMVTWTAPSNTGGLSLKYKVYRNGDEVHSMRTMSTTTTTTWNGLTANTQYTVRVLAFNELGDGGEVTRTGRTRPQGNTFYLSIQSKTFANTSPNTEVYGKLSYLNFSTVDCIYIYIMHIQILHQVCMYVHISHLSRRCLFSFLYL